MEEGRAWASLKGLRAPFGALKILRIDFAEAECSHLFLPRKIFSMPARAGRIKMPGF